jgi:hypothetical protein
VAAKVNKKISTPNLFSNIFLVLYVFFQKNRFILK